MSAAAEHKDRLSSAGWPRPRAEASICDPSLARNPAELTWRLSVAIRCGRNASSDVDGECGRPKGAEHDW